MVDFRVNDVDSNTFARFPVKMEVKAVEFDTTNWSTPQVIAEADSAQVAYGYTINSLLASSTDSAGNNLVFMLQRGVEPVVGVPVAFCPVAVGAGTNYLESSISVLDSETMAALVRIDNNGNPYVGLGVDWKLLVKLSVTPSASKKVLVVSVCNFY